MAVRVIRCIPTRTVVPLPYSTRWCEKKGKRHQRTRLAQEIQRFHLLFFLSFMHFHIAEMLRSHSFLLWVGNLVWIMKGLKWFTKWNSTRIINHGRIISECGRVKTCWARTLIRVYRFSLFFSTGFAGDVYLDVMPCVQVLALGLVKGQPTKYGNARTLVITGAPSVQSCATSACAMTASTSPRSWLCQDISLIMRK